jgi:hypothetical protein
MGIIAFLVGILVNVVGSALTTAKIKATKATIQKIDGLLTQRMDAFTIALQAQNKSPQPDYLVNALLYPATLTGLPANRSPVQLAGGNPSRARVLGQKALYRVGFPQTLAEAGQAVPASDVPATQSSEAMYLFLTSLDSFGVPAVDEDAFTSSEVADTDGDGLKEFIDAWGKPLRFYRWPTRLIRTGDPASDSQTLISPPPALGNDPYVIAVNTTPYFGKDGHDTGSFFASLPDVKTLGKDPDDELGAIQNATWTYNDGSGNQQMDPATFETILHTPDTWSLSLIVSAGQDGEWGLHDMDDTANHGHLAQPDFSKIEAILDNLTNRQP